MSGPSAGVVSAVLDLGGARVNREKRILAAPRPTAARCGPSPRAKASTPALRPSPLSPLVQLISRINSASTRRGPPGGAFTAAPSLRASRGPRSGEPQHFHCLGLVALPLLAGPARRLPHPDGFF